MYETRCQSRFDARYWMLGASALGRPRGMVWGGWREEGQVGHHIAVHIICTYKSLTARFCKKIYPIERIFQNSFHDHIIRDEKDYEKIWEYIENNPIKWETDCFFT